MVGVDKSQKTSSTGGNIFIMTTYDTNLPMLSEIQQLLLREKLDGREGSNRCKNAACAIRANHDYEAIYCWLEEYRHSPQTFRSYQKEAERLLLWCVLQHKKAFSSLTRDDLALYFSFIADPEPREFWCAPQGGRGHKRGSSHWKPFSGPLSGSAQASAISAIGSLFNYLFEARYLDFNPMSLMKKKFSNLKKSASEQDLAIQERILEMDEWQAILEALENLPEKTAHQKDDKERLRFTLYLFYYSGMRIHEVTSHNWSAFRKRQGLWWLFIVGKGNKLNKIPVHDELFHAVNHYRTHLGYSPEPTPEENIPLIASWTTGKAITARQINKWIKMLALEAAKKYVDTPSKQTKLKKVSAHWLRHYSASMQSHFGVSEKHIQENLRHASSQTTKRYIHSIDQNRHEDLQKLKLLIHTEVKNELFDDENS